MHDSKIKFELYEKQGDEAVKRAESFTLTPPFDTPGDYHYLVQDRIPVYNEAVKNYELAHNELTDLPEEKKIEFKKKLDQTYTALDELENYLNYEPFEKTRNPRDPIHKATKRPANEIAPEKINPSLSEIDQWLCYGERPPADLIKEIIIEARKEAQKSRLIVCAALLDDTELFNDIVDEEYSIDYDAYRNQKSSGMSTEDLGYEPNNFISARRMRSAAESYLDKWQSDVSQEISAWLEKTSNNIS